MAGSASELSRCRLPMVAARWMLACGVIVMAVTAVATYLTVARAAQIRPEPLAMIMAIVAVALVRYARIPTQVGPDVVMVVWAELGLVIALCLLPVYWVPVAYAVGAVVGHAHRLRTTDRALRVRVGYAMASVTTAASAATAVAAYVQPRVSAVDPGVRPVEVDLSRPVTFLPLALAILVYAVVSSALTAAWVRLDTPSRLPEIWVRLVLGKGHMIFGTVVASFAVAVVVAVDRKWLVAMAPVLLALHRAYAFHLRSAAERGNWVTLAGATGELRQGDEQAVARAAIRGAVDLFGPHGVELVLDRPVGRLRYLSASGDLPPRRVAELASLNTLGSPAAQRPRPARNWLAAWLPLRRSAPWVAVRRLAVGGTQLGEIRLSFLGPGALTPADEHAFSTFADTVASALHDAATSRRLETMAAQTAFESVHDPLTGLNNRSTLIALGNAHLQEAAPGPLVALVLLDLDGFQKVNDSLGLAAGDRLLNKLGRRLASHRRPGEILGRAGADEFAILLTDATARASAAPGSERGWTHPVERAREVRALLAEPVEVQPGVHIVVEASAGIAVEAAGSGDVSELLRRAELAVHQAKREPSRICRYDPAARYDATDRLTLLAEFRDALSAPDQLLLEIQPTVDLRTGVPVSAEALVRWQHPDRGLLAPGQFMPVIEPTELSVQLTGRVLGMAVAVAAGWVEQGLRLPISVNLCPRCILDPALPDRLEELLAAHRLPPDLLILEITESVTADVGAARPVMARLRAAGVKISVDDFGTGSASLQFLANVAVDEVKIDRASVSAMVESAESAAIVRTMVDLAHRLGLRVVAEGVETEPQRAMLRETGVTVGQGYHLQPPRPVEESTAVLLDLLRPPALTPDVPVSPVLPTSPRDLAAGSAPNPQVSQTCD